MSGRERGEVSLISVLVACTLMVVILAATLSIFEGFVAKASDANRRTEAEDVARTAADRIARDLRNASPTPDQARAVDVASGNDLIFKTVDPAGPNTGTNLTNTKRVRYCLDPAGRLREQTQTWTTTPLTPAVPSDSACPGAGWTRTAFVAASIANAANGGFPVFSYDAPDPTDIAEIHVDLLIDTDLTRPPGATRLSTGVFLRNQNRRPTAAFTATRTAGGFVLNASASDDPDSDRLEFAWFDGAARVGGGISFTYTGLAAGSPHQLRVEVTDPANLTGVSPTQSVTA